jgi:hypothetical protein
MVPPPPSPRLDLYWIPLGVGASVVRTSGRIYEAGSAALAHRRRGALYHSALTAQTEEGRYAIEMAPSPDGLGAGRGVVAQGPVGLRALGRWRVFRYEVRRGLGGEIPDLPAAVASPVLVSCREAEVRAVLRLVPRVPTPVWGRDELRTGEMWNSNSVTAWLLASCGLLTAAGPPPVNGRAPGWRAGVVASTRQAEGRGARAPGAGGPAG